MFRIVVPLLAAAAFSTHAAAMTASHPASRACASSDQSPIVSKMPAAHSSMVPPGAVSLTVCRYSGLNPPRGVRRFRLIGARATSNRAMIATLASELSAIAARPPDKPINCPADSGAAVVAAFVYPSGNVTVRVGLSGCNTVSNGHLRRLALGAPIVQQLGGFPQALAGIPPWPRVPIAEPG